MACLLALGSYPDHITILVIAAGTSVFALLCLYSMARSAASIYDTLERIDERLARRFPTELEEQLDEVDKYS